MRLTLAGDELLVLGSAKDAEELVSMLDLVVKVFHR